MAQPEEIQPAASQQPIDTSVAAPVESPAQPIELTSKAVTLSVAHFWNVWFERP